jgi:3-isopropylmalate dehydrogenase
MNTLIGIIEGEGIGREIMSAAVRCLDTVCSYRGVALEFQRYQGVCSGPLAFAELRQFYEKIRGSNGVILRSSIPASLCYQLRVDFGLVYKLVHIKPLPGTEGIAALRPDLLDGADLLLIRENTMGAYHSSYRAASDSEIIYGSENYLASKLRQLAEVAFNQAVRRRKRLLLLVKDEVLGVLGEAWRSAFCEESRSHPEVAFEISPPDSGSARLFLSPREFDVVVAPDSEGDLLADQLAVLLCGTRAVTPSVNCSLGRFATYQTIHGTGKRLQGKDIANPAGMMCAAASMLKRSFNWHYEAEAITKGVEDVVCQTLERASVGQNGDLVLDKCGTQEFVDRVIQRVQGYLDLHRSHFDRAG